MDLTLQTNGREHSGAERFAEMFELATADTKTDTSVASGTDVITNFAGQYWAKDVIAYGEALRRFDKGVLIDNRLVGTGGKSVTWAKTTSGGLSVTTTKTEGSVARTRTDLSNLGVVTVTFAQTDIKQGDVTVSHEAQILSEIDLVKQGRYVVQNALAQDVDSYLSTMLQGLSTTVENNVIAGGRDDTESLTSSDNMSPDYIADATALIEANNFSPAYLYVHPLARKYLVKSSQFTNASERGRDDVIYSTTNTPKYAQGATDVWDATKTWDVAGSTSILVGEANNGMKVAGALAIKEKPMMSYEFQKKYNVHHIYYDQAFKGSLVQPDAISIIQSAD